MSSFGIRSRLKTGLKRVLGVGPGADTSPPNWQSRPPEPSSAPARPASPVEVAAEPLLKETPVEATPDRVVALEDAKPAEYVAIQASPDAITPDEMDDTAGLPLTMESVQELFDEMVRPALQGDGGDITLIRIENENVYVKLVGACSTCPSSIMTMKMGVEALLKEEFPMMNDLIDVSSLAVPAQ
ncbi:MAG: Fe-S cluster biogenesis protein NfuA [Myxococcota bacterium]|jgi:Fe-S cluster biogenesis protein NfuA